MEKQICNNCGNEMPFFMSEEGSETDGIRYCINERCELFQMQQPHTDGQSIVSFHRNGKIKIIRKGRFSVNEENLKQVAEQLKRHFTEDKTIALTETNNETGSDLTLSSSDFSQERAIQVTRILDPEYAKSASNKVVSWKTYETIELVRLIEIAIERKTRHYTIKDMNKMCLVLEPTIDVFWAFIFRTNQNLLKMYFTDQPWFSIAVVGHENIIILSGAELCEW